MSGNNRLEATYSFSTKLKHSQYVIDKKQSASQKMLYRARKGQKLAKVGKLFTFNLCIL